MWYTGNHPLCNTYSKGPRMGEPAATHIMEGGHTINMYTILTVNMQIIHLQVVDDKGYIFHHIRNSENTSHINGCCLYHISQTTDNQFEFT